MKQLFPLPTSLKQGEKNQGKKSEKEKFRHTPKILWSFACHTYKKLPWLNNLCIKTVQRSRNLRSNTMGQSRGADTCTSQVAHHTRAPTWTHVLLVVNRLTSPIWYRNKKNSTTWRHRNGECCCPRNTCPYMNCGVRVLWLCQFSSFCHLWELLYLLFMEERLQD